MPKQAKSELVKKYISGILLLLSFSCQENDISGKPCLLSVEQISGRSTYYSYDNKDQLISYSSSNVLSSILTYNNKGKIISELDNGKLQINYSYDAANNLILWSQEVEGYPVYNFQVKFMYNSFGQDTLIQYFNYNLASSSYYLGSFTRLKFSTTSTKNYSERITFDSASNLIYTEKYQWDNHPNPYLSNPFFINEPPPSNNMVHYTNEQPGDVTSVVDYEYTYNSNGFPTNQSVKGNIAFSHTFSYSNCK